MKFCPKDGSLLVPKKKGKTTVLHCNKCGKDYEMKEKLKIGGAVVEESKKIVVIGKDEAESELPTTETICPKCQFNEAYWWVQQTRSGDEPPTMFFKCKRCKYSWRVYG